MSAKVFEARWDKFRLQASTRLKVSEIFSVGGPILGIILSSRVKTSLKDISAGDILIGPYGKELVTFADPGLMNSVFRASSFQIER